MMQLSDFDYDLPEHRIALRPARPRSSARLLVARGDRFADSTVAALGDWLEPGDLLVFNDTRVLAARLCGVRRRQTESGSGEARIEATLLTERSDNVWLAMARPARKVKPGEVIHFGGRLEAQVLERAEGGIVTLRFSLSGKALREAVDEMGAMPLPPYIATRRPADAHDRRDYQTVFAEKPGAVAAPTAALHFDDTVLAKLAERGVESTRVTLHVGAGTFLPVKSEDISRHRMHAESGEIGEAAAEAVARTRRRGRRVIPVGTTSLRVLETAAAQGGGAIVPWRGETSIFIRPGYRFLAADGLMTNFHLPRSTLLMLVSAMMGRQRILRIYAHALDHGYRFYSYGDACLLFPAAAENDTPGRRQHISSKRRLY